MYSLEEGEAKARAAARRRGAGPRRPGERREAQSERRHLQPRAQRRRRAGSKGLETVTEARGQPAAEAAAPGRGWRAGWGALAPGAAPTRPSCALGRGCGTMGAPSPRLPPPAAQVKAGRRAAPPGGGGKAAQAGAGSVWSRRTQEGWGSGAGGR